MPHADPHPFRDVVVMRRAGGTLKNPDADNDFRGKRGDGSQID